MYKITSTTTIKRINDNSCIPTDSKNSDYQQFIQDVSEQGIEIVEETTGVVDGPEYFFIHPPREGDLHILSFAEFPSIRTSVFSDTTSKIRSSGTVTMTKTYKDQVITQVETTQEYQGKTAIDIPYKKNFRAHHLKASAKSELGTILGNYFFSEKLGFVRMDYTLPDKTSISIRLSGIDFNEREN